MTWKNKNGPINTKLDDAAIYDIVCNSTPTTRSEFAARYGVTESYVGQIANGSKHQFHPAAIRGRKDKRE